MGEWAKGMDGLYWDTNAMRGIRLDVAPSMAVAGESIAMLRVETAVDGEVVSLSCHAKTPEAAVKGIKIRLAAAMMECDEALAKLEGEG